MPERVIAMEVEDIDGVKLKEFVGNQARFFLEFAQGGLPGRFPGLDFSCARLTMLPRGFRPESGAAAETRRAIPPRWCEPQSRRPCHGELAYLIGSYYHIEAIALPPLPVPRERVGVRVISNVL